MYSVHSYLYVHLYARVRFVCYVFVHSTSVPHSCSLSSGFVDLSLVHKLKVKFCLTVHAVVHKYAKCTVRVLFRCVVVQC
jgi:hypothetical protein